MKYLGIDYGLKKVGLAISEGELASPDHVVEINSLKDAVEKITHQIRRSQADQVIIGLPEGEMGKAVKKFVRAMQDNGLVILPVDETLSSKNAQKSMIEMGFSKKDRRGGDAQAAALILQNYLDEKN